MNESFHRLKKNNQASKSLKRLGCLINKIFCERLILHQRYLKKKKKSGNFNNFFNSLTSKELDELWKDKRIRKKIERQLREPGGLHEWHLVSRAPQFKHWNISVEEIKDLRTAISDVKFVNPNGVHGGLGSTKAHNELLAIIDTSSDYDTFVRRLYFARKKYRRMQEKIHKLASLQIAIYF